MKFRNAKGAVTIFVTLLLIPSMLVSGTAVDLARIHTVRSIVQDANQLAANSVLSQYEAMLNDIYGLFTVMEDDPILGDMLNEYIEVAIFGEDWQDKQFGTFQLFYGSRVQPTTIEPAEGQHLRNPDVLRRQIEEYVKFRAPVIIIEEIWERIDKFKKLKADSEVIEQKMAVDGKIDEIDKIFQKVYNLINEINIYPDTERAAFDSINTYLDNIKSQMQGLEETRNDWTAAHEAGNNELMMSLEEKYNAIIRNVLSLVEGGEVGVNWKSGEYDENGEWVEGSWEETIRFDGLNKAIEKSIDNLRAYNDKMVELVSLCENADQKKAELSQMIDELERKLDSGECSEDLVEGMKKPQITIDENGNEVERTIIEEYRSLFKYSLKPMADAVKNVNEPAIIKTIEILESVGFGRVINNELEYPRLSRDRLAKMDKEEPFGINNIVVQGTYSGIDTTLLKVCAEVTNYRYSAPNEFKSFQDQEVFSSTKNHEFYKVLSDRYKTSGNNHKKYNDETKKGIGRLLKDVQKTYDDLTRTLIPKPEGAQFYKAEEEDSESFWGFGHEGNWGEEDEAQEQTRNALNDSIISKFGDLLDEAGNKVLFVAYVSGMFSNYTTVSGEKTLSGVPMNTDVNYFLQSELEYLFNGNEKSARSNIAAVSGLIFLTRFVFNYTSTFIIPQINQELLAISSLAGPYALIVREVARLGYALAESAIDMTELLAIPGRGVPLIKTNISEWTFSISGGVGIPETIGGFLGREPNDAGGTYYVDYLRIFLLFKNADELAQRTADLITWNLTNKKNDINADEEIMASTPLFDLGEGFTDFTITTTVDLRMLFLSMPFAQRGIRGVIPPKTMPVIVTDYRGY